MGNGVMPNGLSYRAHPRLYLCAEQGCPHSRRVLERKRTTRGRSHRPLDQDVISFPPHELTPRGRVTWRPASDGENS
jgi:hypothetical protein